MKNRKAIFLLALITFAVYFSAFWNRFVWDDEQFIYGNAYVQNFTLEKIFTTSTTEGAGIISNYYRPLTTLSFAIDNAIWGLHPFGFHLTNLALHISAGLLLFLILKKIRVGNTAAFVIALLFLIHPLQTEAVTYINSRGDSLYTLFGFLSLFTFIQLLQFKHKAIQVMGIEFPASPLLLGILTSFWYLCSILSKEIGIIFGGLLFITWLLEIQHQTNDGKQPLSLMKLMKKWQAPIVALFICAVIALGYLALRSTSLNFHNSFNFYQDQSSYSQNIGVRLLTFTKVLFVYVRLLVVPYPLHMERSIDQVESIVSVWPWMFLAMNILVLIFAVKRLRGGHPLALYAWLWFYISLLPVSGIIPINGILYEHWLYVPMIGFFLLLYVFFRSLPLHAIHNINLYRLWLLLPIFIIAAILTIRQNYFWSTPIRLYTYLLNYTASGRIYNNLAMAYAETDQTELALKNYDEALSFGDVYPQIHHNKGNLYRKLGNNQAAIAEFKRAIEMSANFAFSYQLLLSTYVENKQFDEARQLIEQAKKQFPDNPQWNTYQMQLQQLELDNSASTTSTTAPASTAPARRSAR